MVATGGTGDGGQDAKWSAKTGLSIPRMNEIRMATSTLI